MAYTYKSGPTGAKITQGLATVPHGRTGDFNRKELFEDFAQAPQLNAAVGIAANVDWECIGEADLASTDVIFAEKGGINISTPATTPAANDHAEIRPHLDTLQSAWAKAGLWGSENSVQFETQVRVTSIVACCVLVGPREDTTIPADMEVHGSDDNGAFFFFTDDATVGSVNWQTVENIGGADTKTSTGIVCAAATDYNLQIRIDSGRRPSYYINGTYIRTGAALTNAVDFIPFIAVMTDTNAVKTMDIRHVRMSRLY